MSINHQIAARIIELVEKQDLIDGLEKALQAYNADPTEQNLDNICQYGVYLTQKRMIEKITLEKYLEMVNEADAAMTILDHTKNLS